MNTPSQSTANLTDYLLDRLRAVQHNLGMQPVSSEEVDADLAESLDSMGLVEFLTIVAEECGVEPEAIEAHIGRRFTTVAALARSLSAAGLGPQAQITTANAAATLPAAHAGPSIWLHGASIALPDRVQSAADLNRALGRPPGWLESHAGIQQRFAWTDQDSLDATAGAGQACLCQAGFLVEEIGCLLVTSEAPPVLVGLAAALHHRLGLRPDTPALEVGGACTGFLAALRLAQAIGPQVGPVLVLAVEAPTRWLAVEPGPAGEAAALLGDAAAAAVLGPAAARPHGRPLIDIVLTVDGTAGHLIHVKPSVPGTIEVQMRGREMAIRAIRSMSGTVYDLMYRHGLALADLAAVVAHGGNGRMPALLARQLGLPPGRVWSATSRTGNLGSASLPVAWASQSSPPRGPIMWTAAGAGLTAGAALFGPTRV